MNRYEHDTNQKNKIFLSLSIIYSEGIIKDINYPLCILFINDLHNYFLLIMPTKQIMKIYQIG